MYYRTVPQRQQAPPKRSDEYRVPCCKVTACIALIFVILGIVGAIVALVVINTQSVGASLLETRTGLRRAGAHATRSGADVLPMTYERWSGIMPFYVVLHTVQISDMGNGPIVVSRVEADIGVIETLFGKRASIDTVTVRGLDTQRRWTALETAAPQPLPDGDDGGGGGGGGGIPEWMILDYGIVVKHGVIMHSDDTAVPAMLFTMDVWGGGGAASMTVTNIIEDKARRHGIKCTAAIATTNMLGTDEASAVAIDVSAAADTWSVGVSARVSPRNLATLLLTHAPMAGGFSEWPLATAAVEWHGDANVMAEVAADVLDAYAPGILAAAAARRGMPQQHCALQVPTDASALPEWAQQSIACIAQQPLPEEGRMRLSMSRADTVRVDLSSLSPVAGGALGLLRATAAADEPSVSGSWAVPWLFGSGAWDVALAAHLTDAPGASVAVVASGASARDIVCDVDIAQWPVAGGGTLQAQATASGALHAALTGSARMVATDPPVDVAVNGATFDMRTGDAACAVVGAALGYTANGTLAYTADTRALRVAAQTRAADAHVDVTLYLDTGAVEAVGHVGAWKVHGTTHMAAGAAAVARDAWTTCVDGPWASACGSVHWNNGELAVAALPGAVQLAGSAGDIGVAVVDATLTARLPRHVDATVTLADSRARTAVLRANTDYQASVDARGMWGATGTLSVALPETGWLVAGDGVRIDNLDILAPLLDVVALNATIVPGTAGDTVAVEGSVNLGPSWTMRNARGALALNSRPIAAQPRRTSVDLDATFEANARAPRWLALLAGNDASGPLALRNMVVDADAVLEALVQSASAAAAQ